MSTSFHGTYVDGGTQLNAAQMEAIIGPLDDALGKHTQAFVTSRGAVTQVGTTVTWPQLDVFHRQESTGAWIRQQITAGSIAVPNGYALVAIATNVDSATLATPTVHNMDDISTTLMNGANTIILLARSPGGGTGTLHYVAIRPTVA